MTKLALILLNVLPHMRNLAWHTKGLLLVGALVAVGCGGAGEGDFVSDNPQNPGAGSDDGLSTGGTGGASDSGGDPGGDDGGEGDGDGDREIAEADIVHIEGNRLYALSQYGGLAVIDVSKPDHLPILGRYRAHAQPFEMYVDGDQVFVMFTDFGSYGWDDEAGGYTWHTASRLMTLDASDPADIKVTGEFEMPGRIQDSRRVGDVLYLVTYENGYCWGCKENNPNTTITSLDVQDPSKPAKIDFLTFENEQDDPWDWGGPRSVSSTNERMYVAGRQFTDWETGHSVIDVVDISDPGGALFKGASVAVAGQIESRWQMDEYEDVLRVVSQPGFWGSEHPPVIETFSVGGPDDVVALASVDMVLPRPESLRSVRFDGLRGYAITFERTDPLFTLDLSDPAAPEQVGELEIPGWVFHMEPRGDRVLGLGFDQGAPEGSVNVSLFDVSDFQNPTMLSRVHFGGDWASFAEDQNRIHKAFTILDELELIMVPFFGWSHDENDEGGCYGSYESGIQLIDWTTDSLTLRGVAESHGRARRALIHQERLLSVSDKAVETFDIANRDAPIRTAQLALANNVQQVGAGDGLVVRLSNDWWTSEARLEVVPVVDAESPDPVGVLDLKDLSIKGQYEYECYDYSFYSASLFVHAGHAYLLRDVWDYEGGDKAYVRLDVFNIGNPAKPTHVKSVDLPFARGSGGAYLGTRLDEKNTLQLDGALVIARHTGYGYGHELKEGTGSFEVIALDGKNTMHVQTLNRPDGLAHGGLQRFGSELVSWHMEPANDKGTKVRFYLDRVDLSDPQAPEARTPVNVPGVVVAYEPTKQRAVTMDFSAESVKVADASECWEILHGTGYDHETKVCQILHRSLKLLAVGEGSAAMMDTLDVEGDSGWIQAVTSGSDRVFAQVRQGSYYYPESNDAPVTELVTVTGIGASGLSEASRFSLDVFGWWWGQLKGMGSTVVLTLDQGLGVLDTSDPEVPELEVHELYGYGCWGMELVEGRVYCPMGEYGLQVVDLQ